MSSKYFTVKAGGTYLANDVSLNKEITVDALGLLMVMLAMHPEAPKNRDSLCGRGLGRRRVAEALRCLERVGLRYRFRVSSTTGEWRTITILFDRPHSLEDAQLLARERVAEMNEGTVSFSLGACTSIEDQGDEELGDALPAEDTQSGDTGEGGGDVDAGLDHLGKDLATTDAECPVRPDSDRGTGSGTSVDPANSNSSESGSNDTIEEGHRRTGYRPSVTGTPSLKRVNNSSLRSELHSIQPRVDGEDDVGGDGGGASRPEALEANWELLGDCLPTSMRTIDAKAAGVVSTMLDKLLATGWAPGQIRTILSAGGLPDRVFNLSGLVISRVRALPESPPAQVFGPPAPPPANGPPPEEEAPGSLEDLPREQWPAWYRAKREALEAGDPDGDRSYGWWVRNFRMKSPEDRDGEAKRSTGKAHGPGDPGSVGVEHAGETSCGLSDYSDVSPTERT